MAKVPLINLIAQLTDQTPDQIRAWTAKDWHRFADWIRDEFKKRKEATKEVK